MLTLNGLLFAIAESDFTDKETAVISKKYKAEILDTVGGKTVIETVGIEPATIAGWRKAVGLQIAVQVRQFGMAANRPGQAPMFGLSLLDKNALPMVQPLAKSNG